MNKTQKIIIGVACLLIAAMCLYPPSRAEFGYWAYGGYRTAYKRGYDWVWRSPGALGDMGSPRLDTPRLAVQCGLVAALAAGAMALTWPKRRPRVTKDV